MELSFRYENDYRFGLMCRTLANMPDLRHAHHTDVVVRINGQWHRFEADWLGAIQSLLRESGQETKAAFMGLANKSSMEIDEKIMQPPHWLAKE